MQQNPVSAKVAPLQLQERYPQLAALLNDLDGFHKFVMHRLKAFHLAGQYSPEDIISESLLRWHKAVEAGKPIPVLDGWMRVTANYIICELKRKSQRADSYEPAVLAELISDKHEEADEKSEQYQGVRQALQALYSTRLRTGLS